MSARALSKGLIIFEQSSRSFVRLSSFLFSLFFSFPFIAATRRNLSFSTEKELFFIRPDASTERDPRQDRSFRITSAIL